MDNLYYPVNPTPGGDPFGGRFGNNPGLSNYLIANGFQNQGTPATPPPAPGGLPGIPGTPPPSGGGAGQGGFMGGQGGQGNNGTGYHGNPGTGSTGLLGGRFLPGWASGMVSALPYGIGTAINGINALSGLFAGQQQLGFLGQKMSIGDALSAMTGQNLGYHAQGLGGYGNIGVGGYTGMQDMADPGVQGAARALAAHQVSSAFGSMANGGHFGGSFAGAGDPGGMGARAAAAAMGRGSSIGNGMGGPGNGGGGAFSGGGDGPSLSGGR